MKLKKRLLDFLLKLNRFFNPKSKYSKKTLRYLLFEKSINDSLEFISTHMKNCQVFETRMGLYSWCFDRMLNYKFCALFGIQKIE